MDWMDLWLDGGKLLATMSRPSPFPLTLPKHPSFEPSFEYLTSTWRTRILHTSYGPTSTEVLGGFAKSDFELAMTVLRRANKQKGRDGWQYHFQHQPRPALHCRHWSIHGMLKRMVAKDFQVDRLVVCLCWFWWMESLFFWSLLMFVWAIWIGGVVNRSCKFLGGMITLPVTLGSLVGIPYPNARILMVTRMGLREELPLQCIIQGTCHP